ncbi:MAG TPA: hypothetical protein VFH31_10090 [Pyrinomonadaceae bacterium]|nr:hypothetical protein [Pyrinomonadaceae bacterium]
MDEARDPIGSAANEICAALRYLGDASYAILPQQVAHDLGDLKKKVLTNIRSFVDSCVDKDIQWIDERVAGGDRLREEWRQSCNRNQASETEQPIN